MKKHFLLFPLTPCSPHSCRTVFPYGTEDRWGCCGILLLLPAPWPAVHVENGTKGKKTHTQTCTKKRDAVKWWPPDKGKSSTLCKIVLCTLIFFRHMFLVYCSIRFYFLLVLLVLRLLCAKSRIGLFSPCAASHLMLRPKACIM